MAPGDSLLLGTDLVKDPARLVAAYDDAAGVTAEFNRNVLHILARELGADADTDAFAHVAVWHPENEWIEMRLRSRRGQVVRALDLEVSFAEGEETAHRDQCQVPPRAVEDELTAPGLRLRAWWTDRQGDYALSLATKAIMWNILPAALGNILGGSLFVAIPFWYVLRERESRSGPVNTTRRGRAENQ